MRRFTLAVFLASLSLGATHCSSHCHCHSPDKVTCFDLLSSQLSLLNRLPDTHRLTDVTISRSSLPELPDRVFQRLQLDTLSLAGNGITAVHRRAFHNQHKLRFLHLENNNIRFLHRDTFTNVQELLSLSLNSNELYDVTAFRSIPTLRQLFLRNNVISVLQNESFALPELLQLQLSDNEISEIEKDAFNQLQNLKELDLSNNHIKFIHPDTFSNNTNLLELVLNENEVSQLEFVKDISNLRYLFMSENVITSLPDNCFIGTFHLYRVNLASNKVQTIAPKAFAGLMELEDLDLSWNQITSLDENTFQETPELQRLNLAHNRISTVGFVQEAKSLTHLYLSYNNIRNLESQALAARGGVLQSLDLSFNPLKALPKSAFHGLFTLSYLNISNTGLSDVFPSMLTNLPQLAVVDISGNKLTLLDALRSISNVRYLKLHNNILVLLQNDTFVNWTHEHTTLDLSANLISDIESAAFAGLDDVHAIDISRNSISSLHDNTFDIISSFWKLDASHNSLSELNFVRNVSSLRFLIMSFNSIETLPDSALASSKISLLHYIDLSNNRISYISKGAFRNLKNVWDMNISRNKISSLHRDTFRNTTSLWDLNVSFNKLNALDAFRDIPSLRRLNVSSNLLSTLPNSTFALSNMTTLRVLDLSNNLIEHVELLAFDGLVQLDHLNLSTNRIKAINSERFHSTVELRHLDLSRNNLTNMIDSILSLVTFDLSENYITDLGAKNNFPNLRTLNLARNEIVTLNPNSMKNLHRLEELNLSDNKIRELARETFQSCNALLKLDLSGNQIMHFEVLNLPSLKYLSLANNNILVLSNDSIATANISHLIYLNLSNNAIEAVSASAVSPLHLLKYLDLSRNNISELPASFLKNNTLLYNLDISNNRVSRLDTFCDHLSLRTLNMSNNLVSAIPSKAFSKYKYGRLTHLDISFNNITVVKNRALNGMIKLKYLDMSNNRVARLYAGVLADMPRLTHFRYLNNPLSKDVAVEIARNRLLRYNVQSVDLGEKLAQELQVIAIERRIVRRGRGR